MKKLSFLTWALCLILACETNAQCIKDIQTMSNMPDPCFFVGNVDYDNTECFDLISYPNWKYNWVIKSASDGEIVARYTGVAFQHVFKNFGGYQFCLEIDKDDDPTNTPDIVDCVTYTTCEVCKGDEIKVEYVDCPYGVGCKVALSAKIPAVNDVGLKPVAKFIVSYLPTPQEILGGIEPYDIEFGDIDIEYDSYADTINIYDNITVPFKRGCFKPRVELQLVEGAGAHGMDEIPCTSAEHRSENKFRCIACNNEDGDCIASLVASQISNEEDSCDPFYFCNLLREDELEAEDSESIEFALAPNPASDYLRFKLPYTIAENRQILLTNNLGQVIKNIEVPFGENDQNLDIAAFSDGLYFATLVEDGMRIRTLQFIIQH